MSQQIIAVTAAPRARQIMNSGERLQMMTPPANHRPNPPTTLQVVRGYVLLPHAVPIIVVLIATAGFALVAAGGWPGLIPMATLLGAMLGGQLAVGAVNELVDAELDAIAQPYKPIPAGLVSRRGAWMMTIAGLLLMTALSLRFGPASFLICALGNGAGIAYSLWFKRTIWSWVPYLVALPLLPIWVWTSLSHQVHPGLLAIYPIGAPAVIAVQIAQSLPDIATDQQASVRTLAVALGPNRARRFCWAALLLAAVIAVALAPRLTGHRTPVVIAALIAAALVALNALIWRRNPRQGAVAAFPCVATGAVALGLGWTIALLTS
jgi:4-hydroxybenzoate polyprenyltransferase